jgi:hypothetical protein
MPAFPERPKELVRRFTEQRARFTDVEAARIQQVLKDYESARNDALNSAFDIINDTGNDEKKSDYNDRLNAARDRVIKSLSSMLDGITSPAPSDAAVLFRNQAATEEATFFNGLIAANLGSARDVLLLFKLRLLDMKDQLVAAWSATDDENQRIMDLERQATKDMNQIVRQAVDDGISTFASLSGASYGMVEKLKGFPAFVQSVVVESVRALSKVAQQALPDVEVLKKTDNTNDASEFIDKMSDGGKELFALAQNNGIDAKQVAALAPYLVRNPALVVGDLIDDAIKAVAGKVEIIGPEAAGSVTFLMKLVSACAKFSWGLLLPWQQARDRYLNQMPCEGRVLVCFSGWRKQVDEFLLESGIDAAHAYFASIKDPLNKWLSGGATDGLRQDAYLAGLQLQEALSRRVTDLESVYADFVSANRGRFFGEIDSNTLQRLIDPDHWNSDIEGLLGLALDQRIKQWRDQVMVVEGTFDSAWSQVQGSLGSLPVVFQSALRDRLDTYYKTVKAQLADARQQAIDQIDQGAKVVDPDSIRRSLERKSLLDALKA